jgi:hypothetical protein
MHCPSLGSDSAGTLRQILAGLAVIAGDAMIRVCRGEPEDPSLVMR